MRELVYLVATTVDGFIAADTGTDPDFFVFDGPQVPDLLTEFPEMIPAHVRDLLGMPRDTPNARFDTVLMGRGTYGIGLKAGITSPYPHLRQIVVSSSLGSAPDPALEVISSNVVERVRTLKAADGADIWLCGGGALAACLAEEIDELILKVSPVLLGDGVPLFSSVVGPQRLTMTNHRVYDNGFALLRYRFAGA